MGTAQKPPGHSALDMKLEVAVLRVSDVERAAQFYKKLGWRLDADFGTGDERVLQFTPPGSPASVIFGTLVAPAAPGERQFHYLVVADVEAANAELVGKGIETSGVFHDGAGGYNGFDPATRASGPDPQRRSYASFVTFSDPDGNRWLLQEITSRFPGRIDARATEFASEPDLAEAMRRAEAAHGEYETRVGAGRDENWPEWYASYMVAEQTGQPLPQ